MLFAAMSHGLSTLYVNTKLVVIVLTNREIATNQIVVLVVVFVVVFVVVVVVVFVVVVVKTI
jgi:hypothetical protein